MIATKKNMVTIEDTDSKSFIIKAFDHTKYSLKNKTNKLQQEIIKQSFWFVAILLGRNQLMRKSCHILLAGSVTLLKQESKQLTGNKQGWGMAII
tara:strand:+ start:228 stop:512 length:285 start_codon:yes stop_codon:yes gene_type:complete